MAADDAHSRTRCVSRGNLLARRARYTCRVLNEALCAILIASLLTGCRFLGTVRPTVKIGLVAPFEGRYRYIGYDVIYAVRLALREANATGGIGGYSVELVAYDDGAEPGMAVEQARKLASDFAIVATIGHFREETTAAALDVYTEAGISLVAPAVLGEDVARAETSSFRLGPGAGAVASEALDHMEGLGTLQVALVTQGGPLGRYLQEDMRLDRLRLDTVVSTEDDEGLINVAASGVDAVFCDADPVIAGEVAAKLHRMGWTGLLLGGPELAASDFMAVAGQAAHGAIYVTPWPLPTDIAGSADFVTAYRTVSGEVPPGPLALPAYEAARILIDALSRDIAAHRVPTRRGTARELLATEREGLLGTITFGADHDWSDAPLYWYQVKLPDRVLSSTGSPGRSSMRR